MAEINNVVTIEYDKNIILSLGTGQAATLSCKGKTMSTDLVVSVPAKMDALMEEYELPDALKSHLLYHLDFDSESATGKIGNAIKLNDKQYTEDDYTGPGAGSFSASFWINIGGIGTTEDDPALFTNKDWSSGNNPGYIFFVQNKDKPQLKFNVGNGEGWRSDLDFDLPTDYEGNWMPVICVVDRTKGTVRVAFNFGAFTEQQIGGHNAAQSYDASALYIGRDKNGGYVIEQDTYMDDFMYFDRALTADDVIALEEYYLRLSTVLNITKNGTYDVSKYKSVEVNVPGEVLPEISEPLTLTASTEGAEEGELVIAYSLSEKVALPTGTNAPLGFVKDANFIPGNIKSGETIFGLTGEYEGEGGGSAEFNIAYGDTAPTDTSKLWVKASKPSAVSVSSNGLVTTEGIEQVATLTTGAEGIAAAAVGTKVYLFGGYKSGGLSQIIEFDTTTNSITTLSAKLPTAMAYIAAAAVGTKVYLFGGYKSSGTPDTIIEFDTTTNSITTLSAKLPTAGYDIAAAAVGTKVYLFGGYVRSTGSEHAQINVFDTTTNSITTLSTTLPIANKSIAAAAVGTKVYLFGGYKSGNIINVFDTTTNSITTLSTTLPTAARNIAAAAVGTKVYLFGGRGSSSLNTINVFDTTTNSITTSSTTLPTSASYIAAAAVGTKVYLFGGSSSLNTINAYAGGANLATNNLVIAAAIAKNTFNLLPSVEIGVNSVYLGNTDGVAENVAAALYKNGEWVEI